MKLRILITTLALAGTLAACKQAPPPAPAEAAVAPAPAAVPTVDGAQVARDYVAAWNAHDAEKAASYFADDGVYFDASVGTPQQGREAARDNVIKVFLGAAPD